MLPGQYSQHFIFIVATNGPNKLEGYITLGWILFQVENTPAYLAYGKLHLLHTAQLKEEKSLPGSGEREG
jgi:hypothetical protein